MKKILAIVLALMLMTTLAVSAAAEISPTAPVIPDTGKNDSPTSPQTGDTLMLVVAGVVVASLSTAVIAGKKLAAKED